VQLGLHFVEQDSDHQQSHEILHFYDPGEGGSGSFVIEPLWK
jgi:hypothetical protein